MEVENILVVVMAWHSTLALKFFLNRTRLKASLVSNKTRYLLQHRQGYRHPLAALRGIRGRSWAYDFSFFGSVHHQSSRNTLGLLEDLTSAHSLPSGWQAL